MTTSANNQTLHHLPHNLLKILCWFTNVFAPQQSCIRQQSIGKMMPFITPADTAEARKRDWLQLHWCRWTLQGRQQLETTPDSSPRWVRGAAESLLPSLLCQVSAKWASLNSAQEAVEFQQIWNNLFCFTRMWESKTEMYLTCSFAKMKSPILIPTMCISAIPQCGCIRGMHSEPAFPRSSGLWVLKC